MAFLVGRAFTLRNRSLARFSRPRSQSSHRLGNPSPDIAAAASFLAKTFLIVDILGIVTTVGATVMQYFFVCH
jgi:hypothetical protein